ncbi:MAG: hypothetical protein CL922_08945 [Deltaproteobacteria bacterium]|jgi:hypothetical protein|nr:hypothetical protein [Deltaproteobacteria bacterium]
MKKENTFFDKPENQKRVRIILYYSCAFLFLLDFVISKHGEFPWEFWPGFYSIFGFVCCVALVLIAKYLLRPSVMRDQDHYDE